MKPRAYKIGDGILESEQIPSVEYVKFVLNMVEDAILNAESFKGFPKIIKTINELPVGLTEDDTIKAKDISTDCNHKFISEELIELFKDKPSKLEVTNMVDQHRREVEDMVNELYKKIVNTPNVLDKLREIAVFFESDTFSSTVLTVLAEKLNREEFKQHVEESDYHLTSVDRKALNLLLGLIQHGFADWEATEESRGYIKNKPEALKADGGNADTVGNHGLNDVINKTSYDVVLGSTQRMLDVVKYTPDSYDVDATKMETFDTVLNTLKCNSSIFFKEGMYEILKMNIDASWFLNMSGRYGCSILCNSNITLKNNVSVKEMCFKNCSINIDSNAVLTDCIFENCNIILQGHIVKFSHNKLTSCNVFTTNLYGSMITDNIFTTCNGINNRYVGTNCIVSNNLFV